VEFLDADIGWPELLRSFGTRTSAGINYGGPGIVTMNRRQKACVWLGRICCAVGVLITISSMVWRWILTIRGDRWVGGNSFKILLVGTVTFFAGICILRIGKPTDNNNGAKKDRGN
jgi:hypothetical protein